MGNWKWVMLAALILSPFLPLYIWWFSGEICQYCGKRHSGWEGYYECGERSRRKR